MLDGRVKTFNPLIFASILFDRKNNDHINFPMTLKMGRFTMNSTPP